MAFPLNRRQLLGAGLAAAIPSAHAFIPVKVPQKWDDTVDVLCVGTGFSGLAAAIEACKSSKDHSKPRNEVDTSLKSPV